MKMVILKFTLVVLSITFALCLAEALLRFSWNPDFLNPKYQRNDLAWLEKDVHLNDYNYRDRQFDLVKNSEVFRIYVLGDSYTFGWYIPNPLQTFPKVLENKLQEKYSEKNIEVINASRHGFNIQEEYARFRDEGAKLDPDLVLIGVNIFDFPKIQNIPPIIKNPAIRDLRLYQSTLGFIERMRTSKNTLQTITSFFQNSSQQMDEVEEVFKKFQQTAELLGVKVALVVFPHYDSANPNQSYQFQAYHEAIKRIAIKNSIEVIDLSQPFETVIDKKELILNPTDSHPSTFAHQLAGEYIFQSLNFDQLIKEQKLGPKLYKNVLTPQLNLINNQIPVSINPLGWVYFDQRLDTAVQKHFLLDNKDRKIDYLEDSLQTSKGFTNDGWPGARLIHYLPVVNDKIFVPSPLYGYPVVGLSGITLYWREKGALISQDLDLSKIMVVKNDRGLLISFDSEKKIDLAKITTDVQIKQFDIKQNGVIEGLFATQIIKQNISTGQNRLVIKTQETVGSTPKYYYNGQNSGYVWLNDRLIPAIIKRSGDYFEVQLLMSPNTDSIVEFPVAQEMKLDTIQSPTIEYLSY